MSFLIGDMNPNISNKSPNDNDVNPKFHDMTFIIGDKNPKDCNINPKASTHIVQHIVWSLIPAHHQNQPKSCPISQRNKQPPSQKKQNFSNHTTKPAIY